MRTSTFWFVALAAAIGTTSASPRRHQPDPKPIDTEWAGGPSSEKPTPATTEESSKEERVTVDKLKKGFNFPQLTTLVIQPHCTSHWSIGAFTFNVYPPEDSKMTSEKSETKTEEETEVKDEEKKEEKNPNTTT